jgi:hypothetical protein
MPQIQSPKILSPEPHQSSPFQLSPVIPFQRTVRLPGAPNRQMSNTVMIVNKQDRKVGQQSVVNYTDKQSSNMNQSEMSRYAMQSRIELGGA